MKKKEPMNPILTQQMLSVMEDTITQMKKGKNDEAVNDMLNNFLTYILKEAAPNLIELIQNCNTILQKFLESEIEIDKNTTYNIKEIKKKNIVIECNDIYNKSISYKDIPLKNFEKFIVKNTKVNYSSIDDIDEAETSDVLLVNVIINSLISKITD